MKAGVLVLLLGGLEVDAGGLARITHSSGRLDLGGELPVLDTRLSGARLRGMLDLFWDDIRLELHVVQEVIGRAPTPLGAFAGGDGFVFAENHRTAALRWIQYEDAASQLALAIDRLAVELKGESWSLRLGRQPVNWASNQLFVPNDFFLPFAAQTFFRIYKPGVDAASFRWSPGRFTRVEVLGVLGYAREGLPSPSDGLSSERSALLTRVTTVLFDLDLTLLGGRIPDAWVMGGAVQGEVLSSFDLGFEGHVRWGDGSASPAFRGSFALGRQLDPDSQLRVEHLIQSDGADTAFARGRALLSPPGQGLVGPHITGLVLSRQVHPLVSVAGTLLRDWSGDAWLIAANSVVSLLDEAELAVSLALPLGAGLDSEGLPRSEFGIYPATLTWELRGYF